MLQTTGNQEQTVSEDRNAALAYWEEMVVILRGRLREAAGIASLSTDGLSLVYIQGRDGLLRQLNQAERQVQKLKGNGSPVKTINLSGGL